MTKAKAVKDIKIEPNKSDTLMILSFIVGMIVTAPLILLAFIFLKVGHLLLWPTGYMGNNLIEYFHERAHKKNGKHKPKKNK